MKLLSPTQHKRLNELTGLLLLSLGLVILLSLVSYHAQDPSWDTASSARPLNLVGYVGSYLCDLIYQGFGVVAFLFPLLSFALAWHWIRSEELQAGAVKILGTVLFLLSLSTALSFLPFRLYGGHIRVGGVVGLALANWMVDSLNVAGALLATATCVVISVYLVSTFTMSKLGEWIAIPAGWSGRRRDEWRAWRGRMRRRAMERAYARAQTRAQRRRKKPADQSAEAANTPAPAAASADMPPWDEEPAAGESGYAVIEEIPICPIEDLEPAPIPYPEPPPEYRPSAPLQPVVSSRKVFQFPGTELLNEVPGRNPYDEQELKETAVRIKSKFRVFAESGYIIEWQF